MPKPINEHVSSLFLTIRHDIGRANYGTTEQNDVLMAINGHILVVASIDRATRTAVLHDLTLDVHRQYGGGVLSEFVNLSQNWRDK